MDTLTKLEKAVVTKFIESANADDKLILQKQLDNAEVIERQFTGVGFYTTLYIPEEFKLFPPTTFQLSHVSAEIASMKHGAGFVLYIKNGLINCLEGFSYDEPWPTGINFFHISLHTTRPILFPKPVE